MNLFKRSCLVAAAVLAAGFLGARSAPAADAPPAPAPGLPSDQLLTSPGSAAHRFDEFLYPMAERLKEAGEKLVRVRKWMAAKQVGGIVISTERNFDWITAGGKDNVVWAQRESPVKILIAPDRLYLIADNIDGPRVTTEELDGLGYDWVRYPWYGKEADALRPLIKGKKILFD